MIKLIFIRHGTSVNNKKREFTGHLDVPLDEQGVIEAQKASEFVLKNYKIDAIFSSDLDRAVQTVTPIAKATGLPINKTPAFREICLGDWEGMKIDDVNANFKDECDFLKDNIAEFKYPNGESFEDIYASLEECWSEIENDMDLRSESLQNNLDNHQNRSAL